jgi:hypothetical protein
MWFFRVFSFARVIPVQELGACPPLGYWDPFGMMAFQALRKAEGVIFKILFEGSVIGYLRILYTVY